MKRLFLAIAIALGALLPVSAHAGNHALFLNFNGHANASFANSGCGFSNSFGVHYTPPVQTFAVIRVQNQQNQHQRFQFQRQRFQRFQVQQRGHGATVFQSTTVIQRR